jgi:hypothetical protein
MIFRLVELFLNKTRYWVAPGVYRELFCLSKAEKIVRFIFVPFRTSYNVHVRLWNGRKYYHEIRAGNTGKRLYKDLSGY